MLDDDVRIPPPGYRSAPQRRAEELRRMVYVGGGAAVVVLLGVIGYYAATGSGAGGSVPVIQAPATPVKEKPVNPGGLSVTTQGSGLLTSGSSTAIAPAPETPDPAALAAAAQQEQQAPSPAPSPKPAPSAATAVASSAAATQSAATQPQASAVNIPSVPETPAPPGRAQMAMNVPPPSREAARVHDLAQEYHPPAADHHGPVRVQLAALASREAAMREWDHLTRRMPALFAGRRPIFAQADVGGHSWWRVRTAGFGSVAEAERFCRDVRANGSACTVASF